MNDWKLTTRENGGVDYNEIDLLLKFTDRFDETGAVQFIVLILVAMATESGLISVKNTYEFFGDYLLQEQPESDFTSKRHTFCDSARVSYERVKNKMREIRNEENN